MMADGECDERHCSDVEKTFVICDS